MATAIFKGVQITGLASAVPTCIERINSYMEKFGKETVEKFICTTGVKERRSAIRLQTASDLCYVAAKELIQFKQYGAESIDGVILITQFPDYDTPATAHILHKRLNLTNNCIAMDINLGCSGFVYGINIAASLIKSGALQRILLCCGDIRGWTIPEDDKSMSMLFGDAGAAVIIEAENDTIRTLLKADGSGYQALLMPGVNSRIHIDFNHFNYNSVKATMDGMAVFEFSISEVPRTFREYFQTFGGTIDDFDYCVFHQANLLMLEHIRKKIRLPKEKMPVSIDRYGNTSSASIPLTIADLCQRENCPDKIHFITSGFGVGLSWGIADFTLDKKDILPVIETDDYFKEAFVG